jgi:hypothetical protein
MDRRRRQRSCSRSLVFSRFALEASDASCSTVLRLSVRASASQTACVQFYRRWACGTTFPPLLIRFDVAKAFSFDL